MSNKPLITIITVCFNSVKTIEETIQSILAQDYPAIEYIIVDGGSKDGTLDVINQYKHKISRFISEPDNGIYDAMNKGIHLAKGDVVGMLNADDIYANNKVISTIMKVMSDPSIEACYGDLIYFKTDSPKKTVRYWQSSEFSKGAFAKGWCPPHPTFFVKREIYRQYGVFDTSYAMGNDIELMMRFLEKYQIKSYYLQSILVKMRMGGVSNRGLKNIIIQNKNILLAASRLGIPIFTMSFFMYKLLDRFSQFIKKPRKGELYAK